MSFLKRLGYYLGGFSIGLIFLFYFLDGKKTEFNYSPDARVLNNLSKKEWIYKSGVSQSLQLDSLTVAEIIKRGDIDFGLSDTKRDSCRLYLVETKIGIKEYNLEVENCNKKVKVLSVELLNE